MKPFIHLSRWAGVLWLGLAISASADPIVKQEAPQEQSADQLSQTELQIDMDAVDDESRAMLEELLELEHEERRLARESTELALRLERQAEVFERREAALDALPHTRDALPELQERLLDRLEQWVENDLPFLRDERLARVATLRENRSELSVAERWERIVGAWRAELEYGREVDAWRGYLGEQASRREVDYLRLGRVGFYYLTADGHAGGVWHSEAGEWVALNEAQRREVLNGLRIARDRRAPELLSLPVSQPLELGEVN